MPKIAPKVKSAIELLIINCYYWSCHTTKMQKENEGNVERHWKRRQRGSEGPVPVGTAGTWSWECGRGGCSPPKERTDRYGEIILHFPERRFKYNKNTVDMV